MEIEDRVVSLAEIDNPVGPKPSERLVESIRRYGVAVPVILEERVSDEGAIDFRIVDGNRRIAAARVAELEDVPARILRDADSRDIANLTLMTNSFRTSNYLTEFWALKHLERSGVSRSKLSDVTGMSPSTMATRELLSVLDRRIFLGFAEGQVGPSIALAAARLDPDVQRELGDAFAKTGRLTRAQVDAMTPKSDPLPDELPEVDAEGRVLPADLQIALVAVARQVMSRGIDESTWLEAAERAFREVQRSR